MGQSQTPVGLSTSPAGSQNPLAPRKKMASTSDPKNINQEFQYAHLHLDSSHLNCH